MFPRWTIDETIKGDRAWGPVPLAAVELYCRGGSGCVDIARVEQPEWWVSWRCNQAYLMAQYTPICWILAAEGLPPYTAYFVKHRGVGWWWAIYREPWEHLSPLRSLVRVAQMRDYSYYSRVVEDLFRGWAPWLKKVVIEVESGPADSIAVVSRDVYITRF